MEPAAPNRAPVDETGFEPVDPREQIDDLLAGRSERADRSFDLRTYLLDPPPTADQLERDERRRRLVRRGSLAAAAVLAVVLLAPMPGARDSQPTRGAAPATPGSGAGADMGAGPMRPVRVDRAPAPTARATTAGRRPPAKPAGTKRGSAAVATRGPAPARTPAPPQPRVPPRDPAPARTAAPVSTSPPGAAAPTGAGAIVAPVA